MSACDAVLKSINPVCLAFQKAGGVKKDIYVGSVSDIDSVTLDATTGEIATLTMKAGAKVHKFSGQKFRNSASAALQVSDNGPRLRTHTVNLRLFHSTQKEKDVINGLLDATEMFVIVPLNNNKIEVYGYNPTAESNGLDVTQAETTTGVKLEDDTSMGVTFSGAETVLPYYIQIGTDYADTIAALDLLASVAA